MTETSGKYERRNFFLNMAEGALFIAGGSFISAQTVLPALVNHLGGSNVTIGFLGVLVWIGLYLPQTFAGRHAQSHPWKKKWAIRFGIIQRMIVPLMMFTILLFSNDRPALALCLLLFFYGAFQVFTGLATPHWFDMYAKLTPVRLRGRLTGVRTSIAGVGSLGGAFLLTWLFSNYEFPVSYVLAFGVTFVLQLCSVILQFWLVEEYPSDTLPKQSINEYQLSLRQILSNNIAFRKFLITSVFLIFAAIPVPFFMVYILKHFQATEEMVGKFTLMLVIGQGIGALLNGYLADRYGNKLALIFTASGMFLASVSAVVMNSLDWVGIIFVFLGFNLGSELMIRHNLALEYSPREQRSTYIGLMNTLLAPFYLSGLLGGWLSDVFGYKIVFIIGSVFSLVGIILLIIKVEEPRLKKY